MIAAIRFQSFNFLSLLPAPLSNSDYNCNPKLSHSGEKGIDWRSVKRKRSANMSAKWKNKVSKLHGDFPRRGARSTVSCQSLRRLEVINYANERLMMLRKLSQPCGSFALGEESSFKSQLARSDPLSRRRDFSNRLTLRIRMWNTRSINLRRYV